jgi:hypothetical protein
VITTIAQCLLIWMRTNQEPKKQALQNAILNSMTSNEDEDLELLFLKFIELLDGAHLELLEYLRTTEFDLKGGGWSTRIDEQIHKSLVAVKPKFQDINFFNVIIKDLIDRQLIYPQTRNTGDRTLFASVITPMGEKFIRYINLPRFSDTKSLRVYSILERVPWNNGIKSNHYTRGLSSASRPKTGNRRTSNGQVKQRF